LVSNMSDLVGNSAAQFEPLSSPEIGSDNGTISLPTISTTQEAPLSDELLTEVKELHRASRADNSKRSYSTAWAQFSSWCNQRGRCHLPAAPETVQAWLADMSGTCKVSTIENRLAAVANAHRVAGFSFDRKVMVGLTLDGIRRQNGTAKRQARAIVLSDICAAVNCLPSTLAGRRDRVLLLLGFFAALRRSELVGLDISAELTDGAAGYIEILHEGLIVRLKRSKTDQFGAGQQVGIPRRRDDLCPVAALQDWLAASGISSGAAFRSITKGGVIGSRLTPQSVRLIVQRHLGTDDTAHGLRAGFIMKELGAARQPRRCNRRADTAASISSVSTSGTQTCSWGRHTSSWRSEREARSRATRKISTNRPAPSRVEIKSVEGVSDGTIHQPSECLRREVGTGQIAGPISAGPLSARRIEMLADSKNIR
jgi:integrase